MTMQDAREGGASRRSRLADMSQGEELPSSHQSSAPWWSGTRFYSFAVNAILSPCKYNPSDHILCLLMLGAATCCGQVALLA